MSLTQEKQDVLRALYARRGIDTVRNELDRNGWLQSRDIAAFAQAWIAAEERKQKRRANWRQIMRATAIGLLAGILIVLLRNGASAADRIVGHASVIDGDTLEIAGRRIGLYGIDAPEGAQSCLQDGRRWLCGQRAALALDDRIAGGDVSCEPRRRDRYGRIVALCRVGETDLGAWMVAHGWALAYRIHSTDYVKDEQSAARSRRGLWASDFVPGWSWRERAERSIAPPRAPEPPTPQKVGPPIRLVPPHAGTQRSAQI